jgi:hypothetical protein
MRGTKLLERLILAGLNELPDGQPMDANQINAARIALAKILPDLRSVEHSGETSLKVTKVEREIVDHAKD